MPHALRTRYSWDTDAVALRAGQRLFSGLSDRLLLHVLQEVSVYIEQNPWLTADETAQLWRHWETVTRVQRPPASGLVGEAAWWGAVRNNWGAAETTQDLHDHHRMVRARG